MATIVKYRNCNNMDVRFENGVIKKKRTIRELQGRGIKNAKITGKSKQRKMHQKSCRSRRLQTKRKSFIMNNSV